MLNAAPIKSSQGNSPGFELKHAVLFLKIASTSSLVEAANELHVSVSSVSRGLAEIEHLVGNQLVRREASRDRLTESGANFLKHAKTLTLHGEELVNAARSAESELGSASLSRRSVISTLQHISRSQLIAMVQVSQAEGVGIAARSSGYKQSTLSHLINSLGKTLGGKLLQRNAHGSQLTSLGLAILPIAQKLVVAFAQATQAIQVWHAGAANKLTIAGSVSVLHPAIHLLVKQLNTEFPSLNVDIFNGQTDEVEQLVRHGKCIAGVCGIVDKKPEFIYTDLLEASVGLLWSPLMTIPPVINTLEDLADVPLVRLSDQAAMTQVMERHHIQFPAYFGASIAVESGDAGLDLVTSGSHAMIVTGIAASRYASRNFNYLPLTKLLPSMTISIIRLRDGLYDEQCQRACEILEACILKTPWHGSVRVLRKQR